ncbi:hypothetical protein L226DRAFT_608184 [Lentinus tigrinus ALCF2SS1-7]|uniref:Uncharacterized protein n=1 Tax=Lentinus tigrinus ALCF2SS1-6 TaxID=1328759 RepID=A0A5C2SU23_9APHY|nr:hypothetical protein L227DRAFT_648065 [Lentinus tigrinus ALCF2SS1-6]RPD80852.1 hypothetical protein L226DRAFT_608184 [Lentinus tigrinus ALCF2SS1-7]
MGKWTLEYHDEVLRNKIKTLVQGAIKRMEVEKDGPSITYEAFVGDLDEGDSFTTSLVDVLVKELAERRTRPNAVDRRLISEKTAKSLRLQAAPPQVYRGSQGTLRDRARRSVPIPPPRPYGTFNDLLSDSDGEEYGTMLGSSGVLEGARLNTDLYDAYLPSTTSTYDLPASLSRATDRAAGSPRLSEPTTSSWILNSPPPRSPPTLHSATGPAWTGLGGPGASLRRSSTIRRPHRSQPVDLNDFTAFTSRRRSAIRNSALQDEGAREESSDAARRSISVENIRSGETSTTADTSATRPFDLSAWISRRRSSFGVPSSSSNVAEPSANTSSSQMWYSMTDYVSPEPTTFSLAALSRRSSGTDLNDDRRQVIAPRLRRGGLRPPESLLLHGPGTTPGTAGSSLLRAATEPTTRVPSPAPADPSIPTQAENGGEVQAGFALLGTSSVSPVGESR